MFRSKMQWFLVILLVGQSLAQEGSSKKDTDLSNNALNQPTKKGPLVAPYIVEHKLIYEPENKKKVSKLCLYNILGTRVLKQEVSQKDPKNRYTIDMHKFPKGTYYLKVLFSDRTHTIKEIQKK